MEKDRKTTGPKDDDQQLSLIKALLNSVKEEEVHIFQIVDEHVCEIALKLSEEKVEEYLKFREKIAHEKVDDYQRKAKLKREETETDIDLETHRRREKE